jgi:tetratricopeptide (TPR) repeat protein
MFTQRSIGSLGRSVPNYALPGTRRKSGGVPSLRRRRNRGSMACSPPSLEPSMRALLALIVAVLVLGTSAHAAGLDRAQAVRALSSPDVQVRRDAAERLGEIGAMSDGAALLKALRDSDEATRTNAEQALWHIWSRSGDADVDRLYATGIRQMGEGDIAAAIATFTTIIERKPDFAEGWNKRATLYFFAGEMRKSLADCDEVMKRNPHHFGALAGYVLIYARLEQYDRALEYARRALEINPNLEGVRQNVELIEQLRQQRQQRTI